MTQNTAVRILKDALLSIGSDDIASLKKHFSEDATFFVPGGPYRIEGVESYFNCVTIPAKEIGIVVINVDVRQPIAANLSDDCVLISFHYVRHISHAGSVVGASGRGSAVLIKDKIAHLHVEDNFSGAPALAAYGTDSGRAVLNSAAVKMYAWGSSPEVSQ